jgi:hypothetical protein
MTTSEKLATACQPANRVFTLMIAAMIGFSGCFSDPSPIRHLLGHDSSSTPVVRPLDVDEMTADDPWPSFGASTDGGLYGAVVRVTTLAADGPGSLRRALEDSRPRLVVFAVAGVIDLRGQSLVVESPYLTVAGQTAPDPGITIIRGSLTVETHDVVIQHLAVRPGDLRPLLSHDWEPDALGARRGKGGPVHDVLFDHCSATWAIDENLSASGPADVDTVEGSDATSHHITLRRCLIAEGLSHATHHKGAHSMGTLVHDGVRDVAILGCLYAHDGQRNPRLKGGTTSIVLDTLMYDWGTACVGVGANGNRRMLQPAETLLAGNVAIAGPHTQSRLFVKSVDPGGRAFLRDNVVVDERGAPLPPTDEGVVQLPRPPRWSPPIPPIRPWQSAARVLRCAGARPARRDPVDARIVRSVIQGGGRIIDSQEEVGGYPVRPPTARKVSVPKDLGQRRRWLEMLSRELVEDKGLDLTPLWSRLALPKSPPEKQR